MPKGFTAVEVETAAQASLTDREYEEWVVLRAGLFDFTLDRAKRNRLTELTTRVSDALNNG